MTEKTPMQHELDSQAKEVSAEKPLEPTESNDINLSQVVPPKEFLYDGTIVFRARVCGGEIQLNTQELNDAQKAAAFAMVYQHVAGLIQFGKEAPKDNKPFNALEFNRLKDTHLICGQIMDGYMKKSYRQIVELNMKPKEVVTAEDFTPKEDDGTKTD